MNSERIELGNGVYAICNQDNGQTAVWLNAIDQPRQLVVQGFNHKIAFKELCKRWRGETTFCLDGQGVKIASVDTDAFLNELRQFVSEYVPPLAT